MEGAAQTRVYGALNNNKKTQKNEEVTTKKVKPY